MSGTHPHSVQVYVSPHWNTHLKNNSIAFSYAEGDDNCG